MASGGLAFLVVFPVFLDISHFYPSFYVSPAVGVERLGLAHERPLANSLSQFLLHHVTDGRQEGVEGHHLILELNLYYLVHIFCYLMRVTLIVFFTLLVLVLNLRSYMSPRSVQVVLTDCNLSIGKSMDSPSDRSLITDLSGVLFLSFAISIPYLY